MDFGEVLTKAWNIVWKHKILWLFGILASCSGGGASNTGWSTGGGVDGTAQPWNGTQPDAYIPPALRMFFENLEAQMNSLTEWQVVVLALGIFGVAMLLAVIAIVFQTVGRIGLVRGALRGDAGVEKITFRELMGDVRLYFWRVLGITVVVFLASLIITGLLVGGGVVFSIITLGAGLLCLLPFLCILIPVSWLVMVYIEQVYVALIADNTTLPDAFKRGWDVFSKNLGYMILLGLILVVLIGLGVTAIIVLPLGLVGIPFMVGAFSGSSEVWQGTMIASLVIFLLYLPVMLVLRGIIQAYVQSVWTLTYVRLTRRPSPTLDTTPEPALPTGEQPA